MTERSLIDALNHSLSGNGGSSFTGPSEKPRTPHPSHSIVEGVCIVCGARDVWEVIESKCRGDAVDRENVTAGEAATLLPLHVGAFVKWWRGKGFEDLPSIEEWAWNFAEWLSRGRK